MMKYLKYVAISVFGILIFFYQVLFNFVDHLIYEHTKHQYGHHKKWQANVEVFDNRAKKSDKFYSIVLTANDTLIGVYDNHGVLYKKSAFNGIGIVGYSNDVEQQIRDNEILISAKNGLFFDINLIKLIDKR